MALHQADPSAGRGPLPRPRNVYKKARRFLRKHAQSVWAAAFIALAAGLYVWAGWLIYDFAAYGLQPAGGLTWKQTAGHAAAIIFAFAAARYFFRIGLEALPSATDPASSAACLTGSLPPALIWVMLTAVTVPVTMAVAFAENPGLAVIYLLSLIGVTATVLGLQAVGKCIPSATPYCPASRASSQQAAADASSQQALSMASSSALNDPAACAPTVALCPTPGSTQDPASDPPP